MFVLDDVVVYSASDLAAAARCEYALLRAFDARLGWGGPVAAEDNLLERTSRLGDDHEQRHLDGLRARVGENVTIIGRPAYTRNGLAAAADATRNAIDRRSPVIAQAAMFDGRFVGFADFLVLQEGGYRLCDTKLARSVKVTALLQLAAYADSLRKVGVPILGDVELALGNGVVVQYPVSELLPVYRTRRSSLEKLLDDHHAAGVAVEWGDPSVRACLRCPDCQAEVQAHDDVLKVAGLRTSQRARLIGAGITTLAQLAEHTGSITGLPAAAAEKLTLQARLQDSPLAGGMPVYEVVDPAALSGLPPASPGDLFFDFEGDPLWTSDGHSWGLEYLFGVLEADETFTPMWAHDRFQERAALRRFLDLVRERRERYPDMHIYHYAPYEKTALLKLAGSYGVGEEEVDDLLRQNFLVDLFPMVRNSIRVGTKNYSLKSLEPLYMGDELRSGDVTTASDSIVMYDRYCGLNAQGDADEAAAVLADIEDYNHYDCRSTRKLRDWLQTRANECGVEFRKPPDANNKRANDPIDEDDTARALATYAGDTLAGRTAEQQAVAMIAAARGYHQREEKPFWWGHFQRMEFPVDEWADTSGTFIIEGVDVEENWRPPTGREKKPRRRLRLIGHVESGTFASKSMNALYSPPAPLSLEHHPNGRACNKVRIEEVNDPTEPTEIVITETTGGSSGETHEQLPFALTPLLEIETRTLRAAIDSLANNVIRELPLLLESACMDVLTRRPPRTHTSAPLPRRGDDITDITAAILDLNDSYIAVHGPPGCGKTYAAARIITRLVNSYGWRVGVVAQSHSVVENLLDNISKAGVDPQRIGKKVKNSPTSHPRAWQALKEADYPGFITGGGGRVIGGTAWDFANASRVPPNSLDLLVIEEAGQFCLANMMAVAGAARNLLLLGDPQQLPQVSQGTHVEPVDESTLGWLVDGAPTLDPALGYFLARSWRMHPAVCEPVSRLSYGGHLKPVTEVAGARRICAREPGVHEILVEHEGNSTASAEEAECIVAQIGSLLGLSWTDENGTRPLGLSDFLVVAAYNAQVLMIRRHLASAGLKGIEVGTVDKFQGRQAPVVFFSLAVSSADDVPRGMSFLLNRNRVNVAVSRAKYAAYIVRSAHLTDYLPSSPAGLVELGAFMRLSESSPT